MSFSLKQNFNPCLRLILLTSSLRTCPMCAYSAETQVIQITLHKNREIKIKIELLFIYINLYAKEMIQI
jgi:hypothetical protein